MNVVRWLLLFSLLSACGSSSGGPETRGDAAGVGEGDAGALRRDANTISIPPSVCGNGTIERGEACDDGNEEEGDGCAADCRRVEVGYFCPLPGAPCEAVMSCGNGMVEGGETCDDRNVAGGDGCSGDCAIEEGWACPIEGAGCVAASCGDGIVAGVEECDDGDAEAGNGCDAMCNLEDGFACDVEGCRPTTCGDGLVEGTEQCDDGPFGPRGDSPFDTCFECRRVPECVDGVCTPNCGDGLVLPGEACDDGNTRSGDGCSASCALEDGFVCEELRSTLPDELVIPIVYRDFRDTHPDMEGTTGNDRGAIRADLDADGRPVLATDGESEGGTIRGPASFAQWYRDNEENVTLVDRLTLARQDDNTYVFASRSFFPLDGRGFGNQERDHNFHFTSELRWFFTYDAATAPSLTFRGDDDVWVFINGRLVVDIGGVHSAQTQSYSLDAEEAASLGLRDGGIYEAVLFHAERHTTQSNYRLQLGGFVAATTSCAPVCGDGIVTRLEVCDDGINDGSYDGCQVDCLGFGPRCGDGEVQRDEGEQCDDGNEVDNDACSNTCRTVLG